MTHGKGWKPQRPDHRDIPYVPTFEQSAIPEIFSLEKLPYNPNVFDQGQLGTCVCNSSSSMFEYVLRMLKLPDFTPSRLFIYAKGRELEGTPLTTDSGMEVRDALTVLAKYGVCDEKDWPYFDTTPGPWQQEPSAQAVSLATQTKALQYQSITVHAPGMPLRSCLVEGYPFIFGFNVPDTLESDEMANGQTTLLEYPGADANFIGGHSVKCVGYDFTCKTFHVPVFRIKNSWGQSWCDQGYFWMDYRFMGPDPNTALATDFWTLRTVS